MSWGQSTFTNAGSEMFVETISGQKMLLASAKGGAGTSTTEELKTATAVKDEKQTLALLEVEDVQTDNGSGKRLGVQITNGNVTESYILHQIGIFGKLEGDEADTLMIVMQDDHGIEVPDNTENPDFIYELYIVVTISNEAQVTLEVESTAVATVKSVNSKIATHNTDPEAHANLPIPAKPTVTKVITIPATGWDIDEEAALPDDEEAEVYPYHIDVTVTEAATDYFPVASLHKDAADTAAAAGICATMQALAGSARFWAKQPPAAAMSATLALIAGGKNDVTDGYGIVNVGGSVKENEPGGVVTLDSNGKIPAGLLPGMGFVEMIGSETPVENRTENTLYALRVWDLTVPTVPEGDDDT